jgi:AraC-like DNA-binding protein
MGDQAFTLPAQYIRRIADQIRSMGGDVGRWLAQSELSEDRLDDPSLAIGYPTFERLVLDALTVSGEPALGLLVGERLLANSHGVLGYAAMSSGTIRQALDLVERYASLRLSLIAVAHTVHPGEVRVRFDETRPLGDMERPILEAVSLSVKNVLDAMSMGACQVRMIAFRFEKPAYAALARDLFRCEVRYGQTWSGAVLPQEVLDVPLKMADPDAFREAALICERELDKLRADESMADKVRRLLLERRNGFPSLQIAARLFRMTPRTLHRRLVEEGTSFHALLEEVRHTLAVEHMKSGRFTIEEVAYILGYSDLANFRRAFKRWESVPPSAYRAAQTEARESAGKTTKTRRAATRAP